MGQVVSQKIPLFLGSNRAVDELELSSFKPELRDCFVDEAKNIRKKPGLEFLTDLSGAQIDGLFWWEKQQFAIAITDQSIFKITDSTGSSTDLTGTDTPEAATKAYFADFGTDLYVANGGKIIEIPDTGTPTYLTDVDAPTTVSHVATLDTYLLALETGTGKIHYSGVGAPTSWEGEWITAESMPDDAKALHVANNRIYIWGTDSLEIWYDDGATPFVKEFGGHIKTGLLAPHAVAYGIDTFYWIDDNRNLVRLVGNQVENVPVNNPQSLSLYLQGFTTVSDALADYMPIGGRHFIVLTFPTEETTILYDIIANIWVEWNKWNDHTNTYGRWIANAFTFCDAWNTRLIGDNDKGFIYKMRMDYAREGVFDYLEDSSGSYIIDSSGDYFETSASVESSSIRLLVRTGMINHGSVNNRKFSSRYTITAKRPTSYSVDDVTLKLRYRDNGSSAWSEYREGTTTSVTDTLFRFTWNRNGKYYERQIEIVNDDNEPILISGIMEEILEIEA